MIEPGTILQNRYRIEKHIGQGGMGKVYIASDERFNSTVAIKETVFEDKNLRKAFEREARLLNSLKHQSLPRVSDHFIEGDGQFLVMEYIAGEDLAEKMEMSGAAFSVEEVLDWSKQLCNALDYLHSRDIIHRDIKPQNLKLTPGGQVVLLDFGLAKGNPTDSQNQTAAKSIFGYSRSYASLEQIQGTGTEPRSDLYSLGATLYHLLTGLPPADALTRAMNVLNGMPDPLVPAHLINRSVPVDISKVLLESMALNANQRPSSAQQLQNALEDSDLKVSEHNDSTIIAIGENLTADLHSQETKIKSADTNVTSEKSSNKEIINTGGSLNKNNRPSNDPYQTQTSNGDAVSEITKIKTAQKFPIQSSKRAGRIGAAALGILLLIGTVISATYFMRSNSSDTIPKDNRFMIMPPENKTSTDNNPEELNSSTKSENVNTGEVVNSNATNSQTTVSGENVKSSKRIVKNTAVAKDESQSKNESKANGKSDNSSQTVIINGEEIETDGVVIDKNGVIKLKNPSKSLGRNNSRYPANVLVPQFPKNPIFTPLDIEKLRQLKELRNKRKSAINPQTPPVPERSP